MSKEEIEQEDTIDLLLLARKVLRYWWALLIAVLIGGIVAGSYSTFCIAPRYQAECLIYVNNGALVTEGTAVSVQDLNASQRLVDTYMVILKSRTVLSRVAEEAGVDYSYEQMRGMVSSKKVNDTEVFSVCVTSGNPEEAEQIANKIADVLPEAFEQILEGASVKIVDYAVVPSQKVSPNIQKNTLIGSAGLCAVVLAILVLLFLLDNTIQQDSDLFELTRMPLLSKVPDYKPDCPRDNGEEKHTENEGLPFAVHEAYRLLRTNVLYSIAYLKTGKIIGITSSVASEYKTTTAINLAISFASQQQNKVLLLDCDLRLSEIAQRMDISREPGLTEYLTSDIDIASIIQQSKSWPNLYVGVGGNLSPNPGDLLCSPKMRDCFRELAKEYDYIIVDFPPANIVSDALDLSKECTGMIVVARQNYTEKTVLQETLQKLEFLDANVMGLVLTGINMGKSSNRYYNKKYYGVYRND